MTKSVLKNTSWLTTAAVLQKLISFAYFTYIARTIGVEHTGQYFFAISFTTIFTVLADFGLGNVLTREGAKYPDDLNKYLRSVLTIKFLFGFFAYGAIALVSYALGYSPEVRILILLSGVTMFFDNLQTAFYSALRSRQNLFYESAGNVSAQFLTMVIGTASLLMGAPLYWLILAYTIPSALACIYAAVVLRIKYLVKPGLWLDWEFTKKLLFLALPFAAASIIGRLYTYTDLLMMSKLLNHTQVGWWSAPYKIVFAFQFIPAALAASLYPAMSAMYIKQKDGLERIFSNSLKYLALFSVPLAAVMYGLAEPIMVFLYKTDFLPAAPVLQVLALSLVCTYTSLLSGALLNATDRQSTQSLLMLAALVVNVACNVVLMPKFGIMGAAIAVLASSLFLMLAGLTMVKKVLNTSWAKLLDPFVKFAVPAAVSSYFGFWLSLRVNLIASGLLAALMYLALVLVFRLVTILEIKTAFERKV